MGSPFSEIFDLNGLTVYSSEPAQIGADKSDRPGVFSATRERRPASKLTHKGSFSAFAKVVFDRDLGENYVPIAGEDGSVQGCSSSMRTCPP